MDPVAQKPPRGRKQGGSSLKSNDRRGGYREDNNERNGHNSRGGGGQGRGSMGSKGASNRGRGGPQRGGNASHGNRGRRGRGGGGQGSSNYHDYNAYREEQAAIVDSSGATESRNFEANENTNAAKRNPMTNGSRRPPKKLKNEAMGDQTQMTQTQTQFLNNESVEKHFQMYNEFVEQPAGTGPQQQPAILPSQQQFGSMNQANDQWSTQMNRGAWYNQVSPQPQTIEHAPMQSQQAQLNAMLLWHAYQQALANQEIFMQRLTTDSRAANDLNFVKQIEDNATLVRNLTHQLESLRQSQPQPQVHQTQNQPLYAMNPMGNYTGFSSFSARESGPRMEDTPTNVDDSAVAETSGLNPEASEFQPFGQESYTDQQAMGFESFGESVEGRGEIQPVTDEHLYQPVNAQLEGQSSGIAEFHAYEEKFVQSSQTQVQSIRPKAGARVTRGEEEQQQQQEAEPEPEQDEPEAEPEQDEPEQDEPEPEQEQDEPEPKPEQEQDQEQDQEQEARNEFETKTGVGGELERDSLTGLAFDYKNDPFVHSMEKLWEYQHMCEQIPDMESLGRESRYAFETIRASNFKYLSQFRDAIVGGESGGLRPRSANIRPVRPPAAASTIAGATTPAGTKGGSRYQLQMDHRLSSNTILQKRVTGILNRITLENFTALSQKLYEVVQTKMEDMEKYELVLSCILNKAARDSKFLEQYVNLCEKLYQDEWKVLTRLIAEQTSKTVTVTAVQKNFCDMASKILHSAYLDQKEKVLEKIEDKKEFEGFSKDDLDEIKMTRKNILLGIMSVIGEFYNRKLMDENEIISLMNEILNKKSGNMVVPLDIEALCALLQQCGKSLQRQNNTRKAVEQSLTKMTNLSKSMETRIRFRVDEIIALMSKKEPVRSKDARGGRSKAYGGSSQDLRYQEKKPQETSTTPSSKEKGSQLSSTVSAKTSEIQPLPQDMSKKLLKSFKEMMDGMEQTYVTEDATDFVKENINTLSSRNWANVISYVCLKWKKELIESLFLRWIADILKQSLLSSQKLIEIVGELSRSYEGDELDYPLLGQLYGALFAVMSKHDPTVNYSAKFEEMRKQK